MAYKRHEKNGMVYYTSPLFDEYEIPHFFASRRGGVSAGDFESLNISYSRKNSCGFADSPKNICENLRRGLSLIGSSPECCAMMNQIHSAVVETAMGCCGSAEADAFDGKKEFQACDGLIVHAQRGQNLKDSEIDTLCVKTADCVPVLIYDIRNDVACALHAGWRGTVGAICMNAVRLMKKMNEDAELVAAIGPCIGGCCYEVNDAVYTAAIDAAEKNDIPAAEIEKCFLSRYCACGENKYKASLSSLNRTFLHCAGIPMKNISDSKLCTCCASDEHGKIFFSHRASGGHSGTQMSVVKLRNS